jgi:DNA-directed RNA polymerase subunit omega
MVNPPIEDLLDCVDSKFSLVTLAARRARQLTSYYGRLGESSGTMVPPQVTTVARKPLSMAFEEIAAHKTVSRPKAETTESDAGEVVDAEVSGSTDEVSA